MGYSAGWKIVSHKWYVLTCNNNLFTKEAKTPKHDDDHITTFLLLVVAQMIYGNFLPRLHCSYMCVSVWFFWRGVRCILLWYAGWAERGGIRWSHGWPPALIASLSCNPSLPAYSLVNYSFEDTDQNIVVTCVFFIFLFNIMSILVTPNTTSKCKKSQKSYWRFPFNMQI